MKQTNAPSKSNNWLSRLMRGYSWACDNPYLLVTFLLLYVLMVALIGWHTNQALCYFAGTQHLCMIPYLMIGWLGIVTLIHEAEHVWKHKRFKVPAGILSILFIYYSCMDFLWMIIETALCATLRVSAWGSLLCAGLTVVLVAVGARNAKRIRRVTYRIPLGRAGSEFRIALLSDIHLGAFVGADHVKRILEVTNSVRPDLIIIAGDLIDDDNSILSDVDELQRISCLLRRLRSKFGTVLTLGNHDPNAEDPAFRSFLEQSNIRPLHNQILVLPGINVIGISDPTHNRRISAEMLLNEANPANPTVVSDHNPGYIDTAACPQVDLYLSGHTHAGQFFPASVLTRLFLGKQRNYGHSRAGDSHMVVTSGAGYFNLPIRVGTHNEVVEIVIYGTC